MRKSIFKKCSENYVNWVIRLGKVRSAILGIFVLGIFAILIQSLLNYVFFGTVVAGDIFRSILSGTVVRASPVGRGFILSLFYHRLGYYLLFT